MQTYQEEFIENSDTPEKEETILDNLTIVDFSQEIEHKYINERSESYPKTIIKWCEENAVEYTSVIKYISPSLREKLRIDGEENGWLKQTSVIRDKSNFF